MSKVKRLTQLEILDETIEFYSKDTSLRGLAPDGSCTYNGGKGKHCAVGRCLLSKLKKLGSKLLGNESDSIDLVQQNNASKLDDLLAPRYRGHSEKFWYELQAFHDGHYGWDEEGLTLTGKADAKFLRKRIEAGDFKK